MAMVAEAVAGAALPRQAEVEEEAAAACHIQTPSSAAQLYPVPTNLCRVALGFWLIFPSLLPIVLFRTAQSSGPEHS